MEGNIFKKLFRKFDRKPKDDSSVNEYAFSSLEMDELKKENSEKSKELKKDISLIHKKKEVLDESGLDDSILNQVEDVKGEIIEDNEKEEDIVEEKEIVQEEVLEDEVVEAPKNSFVNLDSKYQDIIMSVWKEIDFNMVDDDIIRGKDLINHNYTVTYADKATKYIKEIRRKYDVVICYLIGFNNEKKGIYDMTYFSSSIDDEWKFLNYYIKLLEKIRNFKNHV